MSSHQVQHRLARTVGVMLAAALTLTGCSLQALVAAPTADKVARQTPAAADVFEIITRPATGQTQTGTGYSFAVPEGWTVPEGMSVPGVDLLVADVTDADGFSDNVNVVLAPAGVLTPDAVEVEAVAEMTTVASEVETRDRVMVAGVESAHLAAVSTAAGLEFQIEQYYVSNASQTFVVTFSFSTTVSQVDRDVLSESVLATWTWA